MAAPTNSLLNLHQYRIEEVISRSVNMFMPALDPIWEDLIVTSQGKIESSLIGRDMRLIRVFQGSMAGVIDEGSANYADVTLYGDQTTSFGSKVYEQNLNQTWPSPLDGANAKPYRLFVPIRSQMTNLMMTMGELQAEATEAFIGEVLMPKLEGFSRNIAHTECNYWWVSQNTSYRLCKVANVSTSGATVTFQPDNLATDRFAVGQRVDVYKSDGSARANDTEAVAANQDRTTRIHLYVTKVDELTNTVQLTAASNVAAWGGQASVANGDLIVMANTGAGSSPSFKGIAGINSWLKGGDTSGATATAANSLLGGEAEGTVADGIINVNTHPELKSGFYSVNGPLTEHTLRKILRAFHRAKNKYGQYVDCLIASDGVWLAYEATKIGRETIDRTNRLSNVNTEGSQTGFQFTMDGRTYSGYTSNYIEQNTMYGIRKGGNNWKVIVPPDPAGVNSFDRAPAAVPFRFVAGAITGTGSNRLPIYKTSSGDAGAINLLTEGAQMPGMIRMNIVPDQPVGLKITGMDEDRVYSDV